MSMPFRELDTVVVVRDIPEQGLHAGDLGAVVQLYPPDALDVEFVRVNGRTEALRTLSVHDVRPVRGDDVRAVRPSDPGRGD